jgi:damage-control phosphatase, subfamily I
MICCQRIALEAARQVTNDESALRAVVLGTMEVLKAIPRGIDTFLIALKVMEIIEEVTGNSDPYKDFKKRSNQMGERLFPIVSEIVEKTPDPLLAACKAAVMGNLMDVIGGPSPEFADNAESLFEKPFAVDHFNEFRSVLEKAHKMVCLADNAGEVFFDRIFIQKVNIPTDYFVKGFPFLNDAEYEDAVLAQIDQVARIKTVPLLRPVRMDQKYVHEMYSDFLDAAQKADLIVIKGQANYELFMPLIKGVFYLFVHKCPVIAQTEGANIGDAVFIRK